MVGELLYRVQRLLVKYLSTDTLGAHRVVVEFVNKRRVAHPSLSVARPEDRRYRTRRARA